MSSYHPERESEDPAEDVYEDPGEFHDVWMDEIEDVDAPVRYWCRDCSFETQSEGEATQHQSIRKTSTASTIASSAADGSGYKTCPDCAEQVRHAARKCRFCDYMFEDVSASL